MSAAGDRFDLVVIGAGPAGMAATTLAAQHGLRVALVDEQPSVGGQIYRAAGERVLQQPALLGPDYARGSTLRTALEAQEVVHFRAATVWQVSRDGEVCISQAGQSRVVRGRQLILATGAQERAMPFPGWTLPGVMTCGAGQILLKSAGLAPDVPVVLAGSGPLLFLVGWQYLQAGVRIAAIVETTPAENLGRAMRHLGGALRGHRYLRKGLGYLWALRRAGVPHFRRAESLVARADAEGNLDALGFTAHGQRHELPCELLLVHQGVVPNVQLTRALELEHAWDEMQRCWRPRVDAWGETRGEGVFVAGDGAGIGGAVAAEHQGRLAALQVLHRLERLDVTARDAAAAGERAALQAHLAIRPFLDALYAPASAFLAPSDDTVICRCEEVTAGQVREYVSMGCLGPNQTKAFGRPGMGPCQGRLCGLTVSEVIARARGISPAEVGYYHIRSPVKPVTLGELAGLEA